MGNKQAKALYNTIYMNFKDKPSYKDHSLSLIFEEDYSFAIDDTIEDKISKENKNQLESFIIQNIAISNSNKDNDKDEDEDIEESLLQSFLVMGHEEQPEISAFFQKMDLYHPIASSLSYIKNYSYITAFAFNSSLLLFINNSTKIKKPSNFS